MVFTAFSDTADYLYANIAGAAKARLGLETAEITGTIDGRTTAPRLRADLNTILTCFSPRAKGRDVLMPGRTDEIDILIATDCISEGQNLQDCDYVVNYDIHWNPVRIIQRFGRVDRIGSLFTAGGTSALLGEVSGLDDFELICFLVVKEGGEQCA